MEVWSCWFIGNAPIARDLMRIPDRYMPLVQSKMYDHDVLAGDLALFAGWVHTESRWRPYAMRYEPAFRRTYVDGIPELSETERVGRSTSWGLLQIMGQTAREFGYTEPYLSGLCDPDTNIDLAARILKTRFAIDGNWDGALARYNGGFRGNRQPPYRNAYYVMAVHQHAEMYR